MRSSPPARAWFDRIAGTYRAERYGAGAGPFRAYFFGERLRHAADLLRDAAGPVLDLGSGPGVLGDILPKRAEDVTHVDLSAPMLRIAGGDAVQGDALRLPFPAGRFGIVVALGLTSYLPRLDGFLAEAARVLASSGRLLVGITRRAAPDTLLRGAFRATAGRLAPRRGILASGLRIRAWSDGEALLALRRVGFHVLALRAHNHTVFPFVYLLPGPCLRLARRRERSGRGPGIASDLLLLAGKTPAPPAPPPTGVVRIITRLNVGGPARQAILLTRDLDPSRWESTLVTGRVEPHEGDLTPEAVAQGAGPIVLPGLGRSVTPLTDLAVLLRLVRLLRRIRPRIVHTHMTKAGTLGRLAALLAGVPVRIHTFHGHVLHGYFGRTGSALVRAAELLLARISTCLLAVSEEVKADLAGRHRIAPAGEIEVVRLGLDLSRLLEAGRRRGVLRRELGLSATTPLIGTVGRVTAVKQPDLLLRTARRVLREEPEARFLVIGGGDLLEETKRAAADLGLDHRVLFPGWRSNLDVVYADLDVALLTSLSEGTPVALIEAAAAGVPAVATRVGGVPSVVRDGETGLLCPDGDSESLARAVLLLVRDPVRRTKLGAAAREYVRERFSAARLLGDVDALYRRLLSDVDGGKGARGMFQSLGAPSRRERR